MTKLHIDLANGILEVEGEEEFVKIIYDDFKKQLATFKTTPITSGRNEPKRPVIESASDAKHKRQTLRSKSGNSKESYTLIKDINFTKTDTNQSLKEFYKAKSPNTFAEKNAVFVYYLKNIINVSKVTLDYIYTCYDEVGSRKPDAFKQSIADTSSKKSWLNTTSFDDITISLRGQNYVDHDLPTKVNEIAS